MDDYYRRVAGELILETHKAIREQDYSRAHESLECLSAIFVGKAPGMIEYHTES